MDFGINALYTITLNNGTVLYNLRKNGDMYINPNVITKNELNSAALKNVHIAVSDNGNTAEYDLKNCVCDTVLTWPDGYAFNIREKSYNEILAERLDEIEGGMIELAGLL